MNTDVQSSSERPLATGRFVKRLREKAKALNRAPGVGHCQALNMVASESGFKNWNDVISQHNALVALRDEAGESA